MRYMYTTEPDEGCREVEKGIYGRPVQTCDESKLRKLGWSLSIDAQRGKDHGLRQDEKRVRKKEAKQEKVEVNSTIAKATSSEPVRVGMYTEHELAVKKYEAKFGRKPHHKAKLETIIAKVESND